MQVFRYYLLNQIIHFFQIFLNGEMSLILPSKVVLRFYISRIESRNLLDVNKRCIWYSLTWWSWTFGKTSDFTYLSRIATFKCTYSNKEWPETTSLYHLKPLKSTHEVNEKMSSNIRITIAMFIVSTFLPIIFWSSGVLKSGILQINLNLALDYTAIFWLRFRHLFSRFSFWIPFIIEKSNPKIWCSAN